MQNNTRTPRCFLWVLAVSLFSLQGFTQVSLLDTRVSLDFKELEVTELLEEIENAYNIRFSYNSDIIPPGSRSLKVSNISLSKALLQLMGQGYYFKSTGTYVIILKKSPPKAEGEERKPLVLTGTVRDLRTSRPIPLVTVYDMGTLQSGLSDSAGDFSLSLKPRTTYIGLRFSKTGYHDSIMMVDLWHDKPITISLAPVEVPIHKIKALPVQIVTPANTLATELIQTLVNKEIQINSLNVVVFDKRPAQISLLPNIGTNLNLSGAVVNRFSINLLAGYSAGVSGLEAGGLVNMNQKNVVGVQIGGLANLTGENVQGLQAAGILNRTGMNVNGIQMAGVANLGADTMKGVQIAGIINVCQKKMQGMQISPIMNVSRGAQTGTQLAGFLNYAPRPSFQFGLINVADTGDGAPFGVINIIKHGYYSLQLASDEMGYGQLHLNMGTTRLYSRIGMSYRFLHGQGEYGIDYGLGSRLLSNDLLALHIEALAGVINAFGHFDSTTISRVGISTPLSIRLSKKVYLMAGPAVHVMIADAGNIQVDNYLSALLPQNAYHYAPYQTRFDLWIGGTAGIRYVF